MSKKLALIVFLIVALTWALIAAVTAQGGEASGTIYIRTTGEVEGTDKIQRDGDIYTFTNNIDDSIVVEKDNIVVDGAGYTLQGTRAYGSKGIFLSGRSNITITNMEIRAFWFGILLDESSKNSIHKNNITDNEADGIQLYEYSNCNSIFGNNITANNWVSIRLSYHSNHNNISGNNIANNGNGIVQQQSSSHSIISGNNITNNRNNGICLEYSSNNNSISGNKMTSNEHGVSLRSSSGNILCGNKITDNDNGITLWQSSNNTFYSNSFINNTKQVYIETFGCVNAWDDNYLSGGNYWSNYINVDQFSGPYQNETGSDRIWDHPYVIDENNQDNYPIVPEFTSFLILPLFVIATLLAVIIYRRNILSNSKHQTCNIGLFLSHAFGGKRRMSKKTATSSCISTLNSSRNHVN